MGFQDGAKPKPKSTQLRHDRHSSTGTHPAPTRGAMFALQERYIFKTGIKKEGLCVLHANAPATSTVVAPQNSAPAGFGAVSGSVRCGAGVHGSLPRHAPTYLLPNRNLPT